MNKNKVYGAFYGVAIGDALGAPTELRNTKQIKDTFGGFVKDFVKSPNDTFASGYPIATVTDDFSMTYYVAKEIIKNKGKFDYEIAKQSIIAWGSDDYYFDKFAGPTTRAAIEKMRNNLPTDIDPFGLINFNAQATNGGAMKVVPVAVLADTDLEKCAEYTFDLCRPTHFNSNAISAATAISCATCIAQKDNVNLDEIFQVAIWGAKQGKLNGEQANKISVGIDISMAIERAITLGKKAKDYVELMENISNIIGTSFQVSESIPACFAIIAGTGGNFMDAMYVATNVGGDTDTMAAMIGGILGGYVGINNIPTDFIEKVKAANPRLQFDETIEQFIEVL
jgi:ADP-ribosylglycohydrolase